MNKRSENARQPRKKRTPRYLITILAIIIVNSIVIALVLNWMYGALLRYEATTPEAALDRYFSSLSAGDFTKIRAEADFVPNEYNSWEDYEAYLAGTYDGTTALKYRKMASDREDAQRFAIYAGEEKKGELYLSEG